jgi:trigger factor
MQITKENTGNLTATIKIELEPADYQEKVNTQLKDYQHKANMPGFRPGKVPFGLVKKMYGKAVLVEVLNKECSESLYNYMTESNIEYLGQPLPNKESAKDFDLDSKDNFIFNFDIALSPEFTLDISDNINVDYYKITVNDEMIEKYIQEIRKRNGPIEDIDTIGENDMITGQFIELAKDGTPKQDGIKNESHLFMEQIFDVDSKKKLIGLKVDEAVELDPKKIARNDYEEAYFLGIKREQLAEITSKFQFLVKKITRTGLAEMNEELYKKVFPNLTITTEEELREVIRVTTENELTKESERRFMNDITTQILEKHNFELPDAFMKRFLLENENEGKLTPENIDAEYESYKPQLKWQLIESKIIKEFGLEVSHDNMKDFVKGYFRQNIRPAHNHENGHDHDHEDHHDHEHDHVHEHDHEHIHEEEAESFHETESKPEMNDDMLEKIAESFLKDEKKTKEIKDNLYDQKLMTFLKNKVNRNTVETTYEDFVKTINTQNL